MYALLAAFLSIPLVCSFLYSNEQDPQWLLTTLLALWLVVLALYRSSAAIRQRMPRLIVLALAILAVALFQLARLISFYFQGTTFNTQFFFHLEFENAAFAWTAYLPLLAGSVLFLLGAVALAIFAGLKQQTLASAHARAAPWLLLLLPTLLLEPDVKDYLMYRVDQARLVGGNEQPIPEPAQLRAAYLDPAALNPGPVSATAGKNLVLIYLESLEATYLDQKFFRDLEPQLRKVVAGGINFSNMRQTEGTGYTMAGIVSTQCGTPMLFEVPPNGNDIMNNGFLNNVTCLGDILHSAGYQQVYMGGAALGFSGKGIFLEDHHYDQVLGRTALQAQLTDPTNVSGWGLYDDSLFTLARKQFRQLAKSGKPFNLTLLTLDTHSPVGRPSPSCRPYPRIDNSILHAVYCTDQLLTAFINDLRSSPAWDNTVVALVSDHYAMRNDAQQYYPPYAQRHLLFTLLNAGTAQEVPALGTLMDIGPTLLAALQVQHNAGFLTGRDLLSDAARPNLAEIDATPRLNLIKRLNSTVLTRRSTQLCQNSKLLVKVPGSVHLGGTDFAISQQGNLLPEGSLRKSHTFVGFWNDAGYMISSSVVPNADLANFLYEHYSENFITLGPAEALPPYLKKRVNGLPESGVASLIGNMLGDITLLNTETGPQNIIADTPFCGSLLEDITMQTDPTELPTFLHDYCAGSEDTNYFDKDSQTIHLELVHYSSEWYTATLSRDARGHYSPVSFTRLDPPNKPGCHAYVSDTELVIPELDNGNRSVSMILERLPGKEIAFELN